jgi:hypothetical protein
MIKKQPGKRWSICSGFGWSIWSGEGWSVCSGEWVVFLLRFQVVILSGFSIGCERRIMQIEDYFLENVERQISDFSKCNDTIIVELNNANNFLIRLFFYSIFYRAHLANFMGFTLNYKTAKKIKFFLNNYTKDNFRNTIDSVDSSYRKDQILKFPIRCIKIEQKEKEHTGFVFVHNKHDKPYCFIINRYLIQFYGKGDQANFKPESFFGISSIVSSMADFKNYKEEVFKIGLINLKLWNDVKKMFVDRAVVIKMENFIQKFKLMFKSKFGFTPDRPIISIFLSELIENELPLGIKYTKAKIVEALNRTLIKINALPPSSG